MWDGGDQKEESDQEADLGLPDFSSCCTPNLLLPCLLPCHMLLIICLASLIQVLKIISNYSILVINSLALSRVFLFKFTFIGQNSIKPCMHTADIITTDQISYQMFCIDQHLLQTDPAVP